MGTEYGGHTIHGGGGCKWATTALAVSGSLEQGSIKIAANVSGGVMPYLNPLRHSAYIESCKDSQTCRSRLVSYLVYISSHLSIMGSMSLGMCSMSSL